MQKKNFIKPAKIWSKLNGDGSMNDKNILKLITIINKNLKQE